jgi:hypothetical protein
LNGLESKQTLDSNVSEGKTWIDFKEMGALDHWIRVFERSF